MFSNKRIKQIFIWGLLLLVALIFLSANADRSWNPLARVLVEILAPVQKVVKGSVNFTTGLWSKYIGLINTHDENIRLKKEIEQLMFLKAIRTNNLDSIDKMIQYYPNSRFVEIVKGST